MMKRGAAVVFGLAALICLGNGTTNTSGDAMTPGFAEHPALAAFATAIDLDGRLAREDDRLAVVLRWPDLDTAPGTAGFSAPDRTLRWEDGGVVRTSVVRRGAEKLKLSVFVAETDPAQAARRLRRTLGATMMVEIPYQAGPAGLGTVSLQGREQPGLAADTPGQRVLLWVYGHQFFALNGESTAVALEPIARWLQAAAESGLRSRHERDAARPRLSANAGVPFAAARGSALAVHAPAGLRIEVDRESINLHIAGVTPDEVRFSCVGAGLARSTVHLFEPNSLLSTTTTVELNCAP
jgi:hypothetical protein